MAAALLLEPGELGAEPKLHASGDRLEGECQHGAPGVDDRLSGDLEPAKCAGAELRLALAQLLGTEQPCLEVAVLLGLLLELGERGELLLAPGDQDGTRGLDGDAGRHGIVAQQSVALADEAGFEAAGHAVEARVQQCGVGLGDPVADLVAALQDHDLELVAGELAGQRRADDPCAHDGHVVDLLGVAHPSASAAATARSTARFQRSRRLPASSAEILGS